MKKFIVKNSVLLVWLAIFYFSAVAAVNDGPPAGSSRSANGGLKAALIDFGYEVGYEVSVSGPDGGRLIDFISASSASAKNKVHIAVVNDASKLYAGVHFSDKTETVSETALAKNAVLAVNGGYFAVIEEKIYSVGKLCENFTAYPRHIKHEQYPYFYIGADGIPGIAKASEFDKRVLKKDGAVRAYIQSKPMLVYNSSIPASLKASRAASDSKNPRTAIAITADKKIICAVVEGRQEFVEGMSQTALAGLLIKLGAVKAVNLDGGGSSTIVVNGSVMNRPSGGLSPFTLPGVQRPVHSIVFFSLKK